MGSWFAAPACGTEQSGPSAQVQDNRRSAVHWRAKVADNRDLDNWTQQGPTTIPGNMRKRGARSASPNVEGAHARDASKVRCTKSSRERLSDECVKTLLCTTKQLAQMCCGLSEILKGEISRTTDMQQSLGCDAAMTAALSSHHALSTHRLNMISAASDEVVKSVSATLGQLELFSTAGSATSVSQSVGLDRVESTF